MYMNVRSYLLVCSVLLWAVSSLSTSSSTSSIEDEAGSKHYNEYVIQDNLLHPGGSKYEIKYLHVFSMI